MRWALVVFFIAVFLVPIGVIAIVKDQPPLGISLLQFLPVSTSMSHYT